MWQQLAGNLIGAELSMVRLVLMTYGRGRDNNGGVIEQKGLTVVDFLRSNWESRAGNTGCYSDRVGEM